MDDRGSALNSIRQDASRFTADIAKPAFNNLNGRGWVQTLHPREPSVSSKHRPTRSTSASR